MFKNTFKKWRTVKWISGIFYAFHLTFIFVGIFQVSTCNDFKLNRKTWRRFASDQWLSQCKHKFSMPHAFFFFFIFRLEKKVLSRPPDDLQQKKKKKSSKTRWNIWNTCALRRSRDPWCFFFCSNPSSCTPWYYFLLWKLSYDNFTFRLKLCLSIIIITIDNKLYINKYRITLSTTKFNLFFFMIWSSLRKS